MRVINWPLHRLLLSVAAGRHSCGCACIGWRLLDTTGGFKAMTRRAIQRCSSSVEARTSGYVFQVEVTYLAYRAGFRIHEVPIVFVERRVGKSKMNYRIIIEAILRVPLIRIEGRRRKTEQARTSPRGRPLRKPGRAWHRASARCLRIHTARKGGATVVKQPLSAEVSPPDPRPRSARSQRAAPWRSLAAAGPGPTAAGATWPGASPD